MSRFATPGSRTARWLGTSSSISWRIFASTTRTPAAWGRRRPKDRCPRPGQQRDVGRRALAYDGTDVVRRPHGHRQRGHDSVLHQPVALVRRQLDGIVINLSAPTRDARRSVSRATAPGAATGAVAAALTGAVTPPGRRPGRLGTRRNRRPERPGRTGHKPGRSGPRRTRAQTSPELCQFFATISSTSGRVTLAPELSTTPLCSHCHTWDRAISAVAASSIRLNIATAPDPASQDASTGDRRSRCCEALPRCARSPPISRRAAPRPTPRRRHGGGQAGWALAQDRTEHLPA